MSQHHWFKPYTNGTLSVSCQENLGHASSQERLRHKETKLKQTKSNKTLHCTKYSKQESGVVDKLLILVNVSLS